MGSLSLSELLRCSGTTSYCVCCVSASRGQKARFLGASSCTTSSRTRSPCRECRNRRSRSCAACDGSDSSLHCTLLFIRHGRHASLFTLLFILERQHDSRLVALYDLDLVNLFRLLVSPREHYALCSFLFSRRSRPRSMSRTATRGPHALGRYGGDTRQHRVWLKLVSGPRSPSFLLSAGYHLPFRAADSIPRDAT